MDIEVERAVGEQQQQLRQQQSTLCVQQDALAGSLFGGSRGVVVDFIAGCVSGCFGIVVGQPFDTVKVRVQTQKITGVLGVKQPYKGAMTCATELVNKEGARALFKGMVTPLASAALVNAILFGSYAQSQRAFISCGLMDDPNGTAAGNNSAVRLMTTTTTASAARQDARELELEEGERRRNIGLFWSFMGGLIAGLCQAVVVIPTENVKVKLQVQFGAPGSSVLRYTGPIDCAVKIVKTQGVGSLFHGGPVTVIRDAPSLGVYFASYEGFKGWMKRRWGFGEQACSFGAGGLAGALSWFLCYPFDVVKSKQQASTDPLEPSTRTMSACFRHVYNSAGGGIPGVRLFFRGVGTTIVRAVPVNAVIFPTFEWVVQLLNQAFPPDRC